MSSDQTMAARPLSPYAIIETAAPDTSDACRLALSMAGKIAADLGAAVIKIVPPTGDPIDRMPVLPWEDGRTPTALGAFLNSGKSLIGLDLDTEADRAVAAQFAAPAQAILTDGPLAALDDGVERAVVLLRALAPESGEPAPPVSELCLLALSGLLDIVGDPNRAPLMLGGHQAAYAAGFAVFSAMMTGLAGLERHGGGDLLDVDMLDVLVWVNWKGVGAMAFSGAPLTRQGARSEWRTLRCKDGWIALVFEERNWPALVELIGHPSLRDPALRSNAVRARRRESYLPAIEAWCLERTREEIYRAAQAEKLPIGPVVTPGDLPSDPQIAARQATAALADGEGGALTLPLVPVKWNGAGFAPRPSQRLERGGRA